MPYFAGTPPNSKSIFCRRSIPHRRLLGRLSSLTERNGLVRGRSATPFYQYPLPICHFLSAPNDEDTTDQRRFNGIACALYPPSQTATTRRHSSPRIDEDTTYRRRFIGTSPTLSTQIQAGPSMLLHEDPVELENHYFAAVLSLNAVYRRGCLRGMVFFPCA